jgi:serine/threonine protein kinase
MLTLKERNTEPIPGYHLLTPLGRGGFGEVWKCLAPGGLCKAIKFVAPESNSGLGFNRTLATEEHKAIERVKSVRHPFLLSMERVEVIDSELIIVMELADSSLLDLLNQRRAAGHPGIERTGLLEYLGEAANVLDHMNFQHGLQHLDVKPGNLFLIADHVKVADFGLVQSLTEGEAEESLSLGAITARYSAPELFRNKVSSACDQYSLAIVYQELLTGTVPFVGQNSRQLLLQHSSEPPNLEPLPAADRAVIARALSKDPQQRFSSCAELIHTLQHGAARAEGDKEPERQGDKETKQADKVALSAPASVSLSPRGPAQGRYLSEHVYKTCLGRTPSSENWETQTGDGRRWLVRFFYGVVGHNPRREQDAIDRLQKLHHDVLPPIQLLPAGPGCLIAVTEMLDTNLRDRCQEARSKGASGLKRRQLLDWLWPVAEALDELARNHNLYHLALTPRNVVFKGSCVQLTDFGLMPLLWQPAGQLHAQLQARYAAPEVPELRGTHNSDQYSVAVLFQEMLTGEHPLKGKRRNTDANLKPLPPDDRPIVARALDSNPEKRFASCLELLDALDNAGPGGGGSSICLPAYSPSGSQSGVNIGLNGSTRVMAELMAEAMEPSVVLDPDTWLTGPDGEAVLRSRFAASLPSHNTAQAFEGFRKRWNAQVTRGDKDSLTLLIGMPTRFWKRLFARPPGLFMDLHWVPARPPGVPLPEITVYIRAADKGARSQVSLLRQIGPALMESLRAYLQEHPERRLQERRLWTGSVKASFLLPNGTFSETVIAHGKDVSLTGMGLYLPCVVPGSDVQLCVNTVSRQAPVRVSGKCVRVQRCGEDLYEAGILIG